MYPISPVFEESLRRRDREFLIKADVGGTEYGNNVIVDFNIENSLTLSEEFEIGTAILSKLTIKLRTQDEILPNAKIVPYVAASLDVMRWIDGNMPWNDAQWPWVGGSTEWLPLGEFYVDQREQINNVWVFTCYDKLVYADTPFISQLTYPTSMQAVWDEICTSLGYVYDSSVQINPSYTIPLAPTGYSKRQVLGYIAGANAASIYLNKAGTVRFKRFLPGAPADFEMGVSDYIRVKQTNPIKSFSRIVVTYDTEEGLNYEAGSGDDNHTLFAENPFVTQSIVNDLQATFNGFAYLPITMDARGFPHLEAGDVIGFEKNDSKPWAETFSTWDNTELAWNGINGYQSIILHQVIEFRGGFKMRIESPSKSDQQSEFPVEGTVTAAVNKLNKNAIKNGRRYYGVTISRDSGLVVDRDDGLARAIWNTDEFTFWAEDDKALWFDIPSRKFKFAGTLEAADGVFSGDLSAAGGTFTGNLVAAGGTFAGALQAASGTFEGELVAATGTFSGNLQAAGGTFKGELQAATGTFSGTLSAATITGGTITGGTITGATISGGTITGTTVQTRSPGFYPRAEINASSNTVIAQSSGSDSVSFDFSFFGFPTISFSSGSSGAGIGLVSGNLLLASSGNISVDNWSKLYSIGAGRSLQYELDSIWQMLASLSARVSALEGS